MSTPLITVVTATRSGKHVHDCIHAIKQQTYPNVEHLIVVDGNKELMEQIETWQAINPQITVHFVDDVPEEMFVNARIGALYNRGFDVARGVYLTRVDDDNRVDANHLETLYNTLIQSSHPASYSWRYMWYRNGKPYTTSMFPWHTIGDSGRADLLYRIWRDAGIITPNSHLYRDTLAAPYNGQTFPTVDANEWLWKREVLDQVRYKENEMTYTELLYGYSDDYAFVLLFLEAGYWAECTRQPTLHYYLGGHSNDASSWGLNQHESGN